MVREENLFQRFDGGKLFISYWLQGSVQVAVLGCCSQITDGAGYVVLVIVGWDCKIMREKETVWEIRSPRVAGTYVL